MKPTLLHFVLMFLCKMVAVDCTVSWCNSWTQRTDPFPLSFKMCVSVCVYVYIYIYIQTRSANRKLTRTNSFGVSSPGLEAG